MSLLQRKPRPLKRDSTSLRDDREGGNLTNAKQTEQTLRQALGEYDKTRLKAEHFPADKLVLACQRAARLDKPTKKKKIPATNTSRVYLLWQAIASKAAKNQLPVALHGLLDAQHTKPGH